MKIAIRVDASLQIGTGHVMRCLTLAKTLKNSTNVLFICRDYPGHLKDYIQKQGFIVKLLSPQKIKYTREENDPEHAPWLGVSWKKDAEETKEVLGSDIDYLIVDHYGIDNRWHKALQKHTKKIMVIDDLADRKLHCDLLLDQNYGQEKDTYLSIVPKQTQLMLGSDYALMRNEFFKLRLKAFERRKYSEGIRRVLVSMGGMDPNNFTSLVLAGLEKVKWKEKPIVDVVLGSKAPKLQSIIGLSKKHLLKINIIQDTENMAELMLKADLAIGAGGTTSWERCCLGLPTLLVKLAKNQEGVIKELIKAGAARKISNIEDDIIKECNYLSKNNSAMTEMSRNAFKLVTGQGAKLVAASIQPDLARDGGSVSIRNVNINDADVIYEWQSHPNTRKYFHNPSIPQYDSHVEWVNTILADPTSFFYIIEHNNKAAAALRLNYRESGPNGYYLVSIYVAPSHYKKGIGMIALGYADKLFSESELRAEVIDANIASKKLFMKSGYKKNDELGLYIKNHN